MVMKKIKDLNYYRNLAWTYTVEEDKDNDGKKIYIVKVNELPGIMTDAYSWEEAFELIKEAMDGLFKLYKKLGKTIPEPKTKLVKEKKGTITYRTTPERHTQLAEVAIKMKKPINKVIDEIVGTALSAKKK